MTADDLERAADDALAQLEEMWNDTGTLKATPEGRYELERRIDEHLVDELSRRLAAARRVRCGDGEPAERELVSYRIPLSLGAAFTFEGPFPLTEEEWQLMLDVLAAARPALVVED